MSPVWCDLWRMAQARIVGLRQRRRIRLFTVGRCHGCKWSAAGPRPRRGHLLLEWAQCGSSEPLRRHMPFR